MAKELERLEEEPKAKIHMDSLRTTIKKIANWKTPGHNDIHSGSKNSPPLITD